MDYSKYCSTTLNGILLDQVIDGFTTLNVEGRGLFAKTSVVHRVDGRHGGLVQQGPYPTRYIKISFLLKAKNSKSFLSKLDQIKAILVKNEHTVIEFGDENGYRVGVLNSIEHPPVDYHQGIGALIFACANPYLMGPLKTGNSVTSYYPDYPVYVESIKMTMSQSTSKVILKNESTGKKIILNGTIPSGANIDINLKRILINGENKTSLLDYVLSDYQQFEVFHGDTLSVSPTTALTIEYREQKL